MIESPPVHDFANAESAPTPAPGPIVALPPPLPKVFIALCTRDWQVEAHTSESVRILGRVCRCEIEVHYMMNDGVARARNNLAAMFLASDCTHLFFLDNDIIIEPRHLDRLLDAKKDLVCALYPKKQPLLDWVVNYLPNEVPNKDGRMKVKHAGTGAWLLTRAGLEAHIAKRPELRYVEGGLVRWDIFPMHAKDGAYLSEDWFFCERWLQDGFEIWIDTTCQLRHIGKIVYPLQFTLSDEDVVDLVQHRYGIWPDIIRSFIASGGKSPGLMGGHRERAVRLWPADFPVADLHQGEVLAGCYDVPPFAEEQEKDEKAAPPVIIDIGADCGAFARWAQKRWTGVTVHAFESRPEVFQTLERSVEGLRGAGTKATFHLSGAELAPDVIAALPRANMLKIDLPGREREIIDGIHFAGRLPEFDAIMIRYSDEMQAFFIKTIVEQTHALHCYQRITGSTGIMKFIRRDLVPGVEPRAAAIEAKPTAPAAPAGFILPQSDFEIKEAIAPAAEELKPAAE